MIFLKGPLQEAQQPCLHRTLARQETPAVTVRRMRGTLEIRIGNKGHRFTWLPEGKHPHQSKSVPRSCYWWLDYSPRGKNTPSNLELEGKPQAQRKGSSATRDSPREDFPCNMIKEDREVGKMQVAHTHASFRLQCGHRVLHTAVWGLMDLVSADNMNSHTCKCSWQKVHPSVS